MFGLPNNVARPASDTSGATFGAHDQIRRALLAAGDADRVPSALRRREAWIDHGTLDHFLAQYLGRGGRTVELECTSPQCNVDGIGFHAIHNLLLRGTTGHGEKWKGATAI